MSPRASARKAVWFALAACSAAAGADVSPAPSTAAGDSARPAGVMRPAFHRPAPLASPDINECVNDSGDLVDCTTLGPVEYYGHRIVSNPVVWVIFWTSAVDATTQAQIPGFYQAVTNSVLFDWLIEYSTVFDGSSGTNQALGRGLYAGAYTITPTTTSSTSVSDGDITTELTAQINNGWIPPPDNNTLYMVYFPPGYDITGPGSTGASCSKFCAYHNTFDLGGTLNIGGQDVFYGVFPDFGSNGCQDGCGGNSTFENLCAASTHELVETTTDAEVGFININPFDYFTDYAWVAYNNGNEVGDMCNGSSGVQFTDTITSLADNTQYTIQKIFSQNTQQCQTSYEFVNDYRFYANPTLLIVAPGGSGAVPITSVTTAGSPTAHAITLTGSLPGVTASLDSTTLNPDDSTWLRFAVASSATVNSEAVYTLSSGDTSEQPYAPRTAAVMIRIEPAPTSLSLTGVSNGETVIGTLALHGSAVAAASRSLYFVGLYIDGQLVANGAAGASSVSYSWNTAALAVGSQHSVILYAEDEDGGNAQLEDTVTIGGPATVALTAPANGATISGTQTVTASGAPKTGTTLAHLAISLDGAQVDTGTSATLSYAWNSSLIGNGTHTLGATITDSDGSGATAAPVVVTVDNLPAVSFTTPAGNTVSGVVPISIAAAPVFGETLASVTLAIDGTQVATGATSPLAYSWDTSTSLNGSSHTLVATVTDAGGATNSATKTVTQLDGPLVNVTRPSDSSTVNGAVTVSATATPASGTALASIALSIDGALLATMTTSTITEVWDTTQVADGTHVVSALATDQDGGNTTNSVTVTVDNAAAGNGFTLSIDPPTAVLSIGGGPFSFNLRTTAVGPPQTIALSVAGLPAGVTSAFSSASIVAGNDATLTLTAPAGTAPAGSTVFSVGGTSASVPSGRSVTATVSVESGSASSGCSTSGGWELAALFGLWPLFRRRRRAGEMA